MSVFLQKASTVFSKLILYFFFKKKRTCYQIVEKRSRYSFGVIFFQMSNVNIFFVTSRYLCLHSQYDLPSLAVLFSLHFLLAAIRWTRCNDLFDLSTGLLGSLILVSHSSLSLSAIDQGGVKWSVHLIRNNAAQSWPETRMMRAVRV